MTDTLILEMYIRRAKIPNYKLAQEMKVSEATFYGKLKGVREFKQSEIAFLTKRLNLTKQEQDKAFFAGEVL